MAQGEERTPLKRSQQPTGLKPVEAARLGFLPTLLGRLRGALRFVDYGQAEADCEALAGSLLEICPRSELEGFVVRAIPRGGLIVLGMLSYVLDLRPAQLAVDADPGRPLLLVDDCALSGARFHSALASSGSGRVLFAHLYSHPRLRAAIVDREARVEACVAAADLTDHARRVYGDDYESWRAGWRQRLGADRYWLGLPDLVWFPWSEPDRPFWNPVSQRLEDGWRLAPPHRCLKARAELGPAPVAGQAADWRVPAGVVSGRFDERIWLYSQLTDRVYSLAGVAADMWRALATWGSVEAGAAYLAERYEAPRELLRDDLGEFARTLEAHQLLEAAAG